MRPIPAAAPTRSKTRRERREAWAFLTPRPTSTSRQTLCTRESRQALTLLRIGTRQLSDRHYAQLHGRLIIVS